jgi:hypothetical protein
MATSRVTSFSFDKDRVDSGKKSGSTVNYNVTQAGLRIRFSAASVSIDPASIEAEQGGSLATPTLTLSLKDGVQGGKEYLVWATIGGIGSSALIQVDK